MVPVLRQTLRDTLAKDDQDILDVIDQGGGLNPVQISRMCDAVTDAHLGAMTADWHFTAESEFFRLVIWAVDALVPPRLRELPDWGTYRHPGRDPVDEPEPGSAD